MTKARITKQMVVFGHASRGQAKKNQTGRSKFRTRPKAPGARQTNDEAREVYSKYMIEPKRRITPRTVFSAALT